MNDKTYYIVYFEEAMKNYRKEGHYTINGNMTIEEFIEEYAITYNQKFE